MTDLKRLRGCDSSLKHVRTQATAYGAYQGHHCSGFGSGAPINLFKHRQETFCYGTGSGPMAHGWCRK